MLDAAPKQIRGEGQAANFFGQDVHQFGFGVRPTIGQLFFDMVPDPFIGIQLRGIGRERNQMQPASMREKLLDRWAAMDSSVVQQHHQMPTNLAQQMPQKKNDFFSGDVVLIKLTIQRAVKPVGTHSNSRDSGDAIMPVPVGQDRCPAHRTPRLMDRRDQEEAGFINEDEVGFQPCGVFFTAGQTFRFQSSMTNSLRSIARRSGFWWLHPS